MRDELHPSIPLWYGIVAGGKLSNGLSLVTHDDVIKWKHFPRYWPFLRGIHRPRWIHKGQWRGALMFSLICAWINGWVNNREAGDLRRYRAHYDVTVMTRDWLKAMRQITIENNYQQTIPRLSVINTYIICNSPATGNECVKLILPYLKQYLCISSYLHGNSENIYACSNYIVIVLFSGGIIPFGSTRRMMLVPKVFKGGVKWGMSCIPAFYVGMVMWLEGSFQMDYHQSYKRLARIYASEKNRKQFAAKSPRRKIVA